MHTARRPGFTLYQLLILLAVLALLLAFMLPAVARVGPDHEGPVRHRVVAQEGRVVRRQSDEHPPRGTRPQPVHRPPVRGPVVEALVPKGPSCHRMDQR